MIAISEGTQNIGQNDGYDVVVGGSLFSNFDDHPRRKVWIKRINNYSTAAGRYQILQRYYDHYKVQLGLPDFSPNSQDKIALQMIRECKALDDVDTGFFSRAVEKCKSRWASLPGAGYGQQENKLSDLRLAYIEAGGEIMEG
jgi:muramidase (phage lysozyme)